MMKHTFKLLQISFFSFLALAMVACGSADGDGTGGVKFMEGETVSNLAVPVLSASGSINGKSGKGNVTLTIEIDEEASFSYNEIERKTSTSGEFEYLAETQNMTFSDTNLLVGTYEYRVRAVHEKDGHLFYSDYSNSVSVEIKKFKAETTGGTAGNATNNGPGFTG